MCNREDGLKHPFISGQLKNYNYDKNDIFINNSWQYKGVLNEDKYYSTTGGIFIINRNIWEEVGGMDNRFRRGQDLELALRFAQNGCKILRKKKIIAHHFTISYQHHSRIWKTLYSGDIKYSTSFLFRKHVFNPYVYPKIFHNYYTLFSLLLSTLFFLIFQSPFVFLFYCFILGIKTIKSENKNLLRLFELFIFYIIRDFTFVYYLFIPIPKVNVKEIKVKRIQ